MGKRDNENGYLQFRCSDLLSEIMSKVMMNGFQQERKTRYSRVVTTESDMLSNEL